MPDIPAKKLVNGRMVDLEAGEVATMAAEWAAEPAAKAARQAAAADRDSDIANADKLTRAAVEHVTEQMAEVKTAINGLLTTALQPTLTIPDKAAVAANIKAKFNQL